MKEPLLKIGTFGTHIIKNPAGTCSFVGTVPIELQGVISKTENEALSAFVAFFKGLESDERIELSDGLRADVFKLIVGS